jgi:flagella basal body P-ring formation protein FlgA
VIALLLLALQGEIQVEIPASATVRGMTIRLGEIATVTSADPALAQRLATFEIGYSPAPGYSRFLQRDQIASELARVFPALSVSVKGEGGCRVEPLVEEIAPERLEESARASLADLFRGMDVELAAESPLVPLNVPLGDKPAALRSVLREKSLAAGSRAVPIEVLVDGAVYQTIWSSWKVKRWETRPVLARDVRRGEPLAAACFEERRVEVGPDGTDEPLPLELVVGAVPIRDLASGSRVTEHDVDRPRVVARGDLVHLEIRSGSIRASTLVVAQQDGHVGERIRVIQPDTGKEMVALVRSADLVEIRMASKAN